MTDDEIEKLVEKAKWIVKALAEAQVGDHHSIANLEAMEQIDQLEDDPELLYAVLRMFSGALAVTAGLATTDAIGDETGPRYEAATIEFIRRAVDELDYNAHRPDQD
jgi:hypothetical protein